MNYILKKYFKPNQTMHIHNNNNSNNNNNNDM